MFVRLCYGTCTTHGRLVQLAVYEASIFDCFSFWSMSLEQPASDKLASNGQWNVAEYQPRIDAAESRGNIKDLGG